MCYNYTSWNRIGDPGISTVNLAYDLGDSLSGSFQELRLYRRAISASAFNDYVMNPRSIQGHAGDYTGSGTSYDLLSSLSIKSRMLSKSVFNFELL